MESLKNKVAIITGASAGIGEGTAVLLARYGCHLTLTGRDENRLAAVVEKCITAGCPAEKVITVLGDIRDKRVQQEILDKTCRTFGRVDILVNNAGIVHRANVTNTTEEEYDELMDVNMKAVFFLSKLITPELIKTKGNIVNVSSLCSQGAIPILAVYSMGKAAMDMFTQCLALELASHGVRVNSVNPGTVESHLYRRGSKRLVDEEYEKFLEAQGNVHPLGGIGSPEDVANAVAFLASDMSRFITGMHLFVDGGRHCVRSASSFLQSN